MKNLVNFQLEEYYYSFEQQIKRNGEVYRENNPYKIEIKLGDTYKDYKVEIYNIVTGDLVESIYSKSFDCDNEQQTNFYGKENNRQVVIFWDSKLQIGLAKTNVSGYDLLLNIFKDDVDDLLETSSENILEFLRSSAPFIIEQGYNKFDLWGRMRYCAIQYILHEYPECASQISFASHIERNFKSEEDIEDDFNDFVIDSMRMISAECDRCAREVYLARQNRDVRRYNTYRQNVAILSAMYSTALHLLEYTDFMD